jgi:hypothetical protein
MTGADERTPAYYRKVAAEIIRAASKTRDLEVRRELLELATRFQRMAAYVERRYPNRGGY